uniref:ABC transporter domain-containing protein n=1 Tax=Haemonchus contortus TaxID=6289 RepID=A0A7I4YF12_HAECO
MCDCLRQLWLLTRKNLILIRRNKVWTLFEVILPTLFLLPVILLVVRSGNVQLSPGRSFGAVTLEGGAGDIARTVGFVASIRTRWCNRQQVSIAYSTRQNQDSVEALMNKLAARFSSSLLTVQVVNLKDEAQVLDELRADAPNSTQYGCSINKFAGGVIFNQFDTKAGKLDYKILIPSGSESDDLWNLDKEWDEPFGPNNDYNRIPGKPPYWSSAFLSLQYAIDSLFIEASTAKVSIPPELRLRRMPEATYNSNSIAVFLSISSYVWGLCVFVLVIHTAREIVSEKSTVKDFLSVMGLSAPVFYLSHLLYATVKCFIVFLIGAIPLTAHLGHVSASLFLVTIMLYGISAVVFAALISSLFKTPNSVLKVVIVLWVILVAARFRAPRVDQILFCTLYSLNPNAALFYALNTFADYMNRGRELSWSNCFEDGTFHFTAGAALIMLLVDIIWMSMATLLFDFMFSDSDFTFFKLPFGNKYLSGSSTRLEQNDGNNETDEGLLKTRAGISVQRLIKIWSSTGERAVDGMSLEAYVGQVTVLLGQNGAGKSTTFSVICGITAPTAGKVFICDLDVQKHRSESRKRIGLCPQANALFNKLTVDEHLWLIHGLKGASGSYKAEAQQLLDQLKLDEKSNELAMNLSGGQKRKLSVSMAVIGHSSVVLLDEPTAGMDPGARRDVEALLETIKVDRTVLLTTHYMDEAELLGDRVAIMASGRVYCCGTPQFLKKRFGTGYVMTVVAAEKASAQDVAETLTRTAARYVPGAERGKVHGKQFEIILPKEQQESFPQLFEYLERSKDSLKITSFGLSLNTLEQVFLKVAENTDPNDMIDFVDASISRSEELIQAQRAVRQTGYSLMFAQLRAIFAKRFLYCVRNWSQLIGQVLIPLGILILIGYLSGIQKQLNGDKERMFSVTTFGPSRIPVKVEQRSPIVSAYIDVVSKEPKSQVYELGPDDNLTTWVEHLPKQLPAAGFGAVFAKNAVEVLFNSRAYHSLPTSLNAYDNARLNSETDASDGRIRTQLLAYSSNISTGSGPSRVVSQGVVDALLGPFLVLALALVTSPFVIFLVEERVSKFAHQQSLTGISPVLFWLSSFLFDFLFYCIICACFLAVFIICGWMQGYLGFVILLFALYFWSCVPFIYAVSFMFSSPSKANVLLILWQLVAAFAAMMFIFIFVLGEILQPTISEIIRSLLLCLLPSFALGNAVMTVGTVSAEKSPPSVLWEWNMLGKNLTFMLIFGCFSSLLFLMFQFKIVRYRWFQLWDLRYGRRNYGRVANDDEDRAVSEERMSVQQSGDDLALEVKDLCKMYGHLRAVDGLTLGVRNSECFGLLGANGAGKTTTFDILTGQSFATSGTARIGKQDVTEQIPIGYCPQFDALLLDLTGRESLEILARMHGFPQPADMADVVLRNVGMADHADKLVRYCSGGQRRKISVGLALLAPTRIIILDEPTAGIDPKARRDIWEVLSIIRDSSESALLLTSHSMDECEALCSRIAILHRGRMVAIGTSQQLKSRFGNSYTISMVAPGLESRNAVIDAVKRAFPRAVLKTPKESLTLSLKWQIPKSESDRWSSLFRDVQTVATSLGVVDFCVTQSSLEETFLRLSLDSETDDIDSSSRTAVGSRTEQQTSSSSR